jgi:hypothetical protein
VSRSYPTHPKEVHLAGLAGIGKVRFLAVIAHGKGTREVAVDVPPDLICRIADALRATAGRACDSKHRRICDSEDGKPNVGHAIWHVEHPEQPMPCIDHSTVIDAGVISVGDGLDAKSPIRLEWADTGDAFGEPEEIDADAHACESDNP